MPIFTTLVILLSLILPKASIAGPRVCPYQTAEELSGFLTSSVDSISIKLEGSFTSDFRSLNQILETCADVVSRSGLNQDFKRISDYVAARAKPGAMFDDEAQQAYITNLPNFASTPHSIFLQYPFQEWPQRLKEAGWPLIEKYEYQGLFPRDFTWIDDGRFLKFYLFTDSLLAAITVEKSDETGKQLMSPRLHFVEYPISSGPVKSLQLNNPSISNCASCHASGLRAVVPLPGEVLPSQWASVDQMNALIHNIGTDVDWNGAYYPPTAGPLLGEKHGCTDCHDGISRGALNIVPYAGPDGAHITYKLTTEWRMPPWLSTMRPILDRVSRLDGLTDDDVKRFQAEFQLTGNDRDQKLLAGLHFMADNNKISPEDLNAMSSYLQNVVMPRNTGIQKAILPDYSQAVNDWLLNH